VPKRSAGILLYRRSGGGELEVLLVHPGGPFWARRDAGAWSIPKGEVDPGEDPRACALRELEEETGARLAPGDDELIDLGEVRQKSGKIVSAWALEGDLDADAIVCTTAFELEWPPRSGRVQAFPEVDRAAWLSLPAARERLLPAQVPFLDRLAAAATP
jgi:predicted NUDIX family NTP pyrophosphohydrolase